MAAFNRRLIAAAVVFLYCLLVQHAHGWREASRCTLGSAENGGASGSNQPTITASASAAGNNEEIIQNSHLDNQLAEEQQAANANSRVLTLNCDKNLIFIAWSHYGHQNGGGGADDFVFKSVLNSRANNSSASSSRDSCYFSPKDCMVNVDYVANECNGLSTCQISLDAQYLHSCKSYSDYLFIIYDCIEAKSTVDVCDSKVDIQATLAEDGSGFRSQNSMIYLQSPNYPNEYLSNLDCNCSLKSTKDTSVHIELLEFDLESADEFSVLSGQVQTSNGGATGQGAYNSNSATVNSVESGGSLFKSSSLTDSKSLLAKSRFDASYALSASSLPKPASCSKDFFAVGSVQSCGSLSAFNNLINSNQRNSVHSYTTATHKVTSLRFYSDDALTRRGFWLKIKASNLKQQECPENFILVDNVCLRVYNELLTWYEAQSYCTNLGYTLALIDNFELDRQLNKLIFDKEDSSASSSSQQLANKKFWMGIRHLNETNWFDYKNEVLRFRTDEANWWPWLVVDSNTYNKGSCLGKKRNQFFLEDCYKRMPFACQHKPVKQAAKTSSDADKIHLRCGKNAAASFHEKPTTTTTTTTTTTVTSATVQSASANQIVNIELNRPAEQGSIDFFDMTTTRSGGGSLSKLKNSLDQFNDQQLKKLLSSTDRSETYLGGELNLPFTVKKTGQENTAKNAATSDSTVLIGLICSIAILIAVINSIVVVVICRRRKFMLKQQNCEKDSKSSQDTMSSHGHNLDDPCNAGVNSTSTLTFSGNGSAGGQSINSNTHLPLFLHHNHHLVDTEHSAITINPRRAGFASNFDRTLNMNNNNNGKSLGRIISTLAPSTFNGRPALAGNNRLNGLNQQPQQLSNAADPLGHIYETISVSSASNANIVSMGLDGSAAARISSSGSNNPYNVFNHYHLHQGGGGASFGQGDTYNEMECDLEARNQLGHLHNQQQLLSHQQQQQIIILGNYNDLSPNESASSSASSASQRSGDFFLINKNKEQNASSTSKKKSSKNKQQKGSTAALSKDINQNWTINNKNVNVQNTSSTLFFDRSSNRFSDMNVSTNTSSPSCSSSTATTMTELNGGMNTSGQTPNHHQFTLHPNHQVVGQHPIVLFTHHLQQPNDLANLIQNNSHFTTLNPNRQSQRDLLNTLTHNFNQFNHNHLQQQQQQQLQQHQQQQSQPQQEHMNFFANRIEAVV